MELWIRGQKNECVGIVPRLKKVDDIYLDYCGENDSYYILVNDGIEVGYYNSEKRALEVLEEIQEYIDKQGINELITDAQGIIKNKYYGNVYEMPKE